MRIAEEPQAIQKRILLISLRSFSRKKRGLRMTTLRASQQIG